MEIETENVNDNHSLYQSLYQSDYGIGFEFHSYVKE